MQAHAYENLDLPLLNRFEKQVLLPQDVLNSAQVALYREISEWVKAVLAEVRCSFMAI